MPSASAESVTGGPSTGELVGEVGLDVADARCAFQHGRLVLAQPGHLVERGCDVGRLARDGGDVRRSELGDLGRGAGVDPQDRRAKRLVVGVEADERLTLMRKAHRDDASGVGGS